MERGDGYQGSLDEPLIDDGSGSKSAPSRTTVKRDSGELRASVRAQILRKRIDAAESLAVHPYAQVLLAFSLAAGAEALRDFRAAEHELEDYPDGLYVLLDGLASCERYEATLGLLGWAYVARAVEVSWRHEYEQVVSALVLAVTPTGPERRVIGVGPIGTDKANAAQVRFQRTVIEAMFEIVTDAVPPETVVSGLTPRWSEAWAEGWSAFGRLLGGYEDVRRPPAEQVVLAAP
jgi:hypothetical protein